MKLKTKLLVDMDYFLYRAASAAEEEHEYNEELTVIVGDFKRGKKIVNQELDKLKTRFDTDDLLLCWTDRKNFRKGVDPSYKGNRTKRKPCGYLKLKNWAMDKWPSVMWPGLEADDVLGILATKGDLHNFMIVSPDKDMQQIPCRIYNLKDEFNQTPELATRMLYQQCLTGDSTDGYSGAVGIGPKRAGQLLDSCKGEYWPTVVQAFIDAGQTEEDAIRNYNLARILTVKDWDADKQEPILYAPELIRA